MTKQRDNVEDFNTAYFEKLRAERHEPFGDRALELIEWLKDQDSNWMMSIIAQRVERDGMPLNTDGIIQEALRRRFEMSEQAVALVSENGQLLLINKAAATALTRQTSLILDGSRLKGASPEHNRLFREIIRKVSGRGGKRPIDNTSCYFKLDTAINQHKLLASANLVYQGVDAAAIIALGFHDPHQSMEIDHGRLRAWYGLSKKEAQLAAAFARGKDMKDYAEDTDVSITTVRSQFASLKAKMNAPNLATVVRLTLLA